ncbi:response regulator transcription factor [Ferruginibacter sp. HRS2-29]|uniref:response regulator n=1 Tax=Ferruginibacter sp. HRS2-29 TaxID=2487334 RepID=UPI0020CBBD59|nr:response regulator transcription factor [Ferruginibacter sp. HRS2-29]MCP9750393.1 DNA-binding response regulator [Ferruginibacter sp. HRS2-29]
MKKFLLIDDHVVVRSGIKVLLSEIYKPSQIDEAHDGDSALARLKESSYDLVMLDIQMPHTDTFGLMEYFKIKYPELRVLIFSMSPENIYAKRFLKAGAKGFISKDAPLEEIKKAINQVLQNSRYISEAMLESLAESSGAAKDTNLFNTLSAREFEIVSLLLAGQTISNIANTLSLQVSTVGTHKARIFDKLKVTNILELKELANSYNL